MRRPVVVSSMVVGMLGLMSCSSSGASPTEISTTSPETRTTTTTTVVATSTSAAPTSTTASDEFVMSGHSMDTAILDGEQLHLDMSAYSSSPPRRGDIIVFAGQGGSGQPVTLIKRVIGIGGETLEYRSCVLYIGGTEVAEPWLDPEVVLPDSCGVDQTSVTVPQGQVFVMGDNRGGSRDSRDFGMVDQGSIIGRVESVTGLDGVERSVTTP